MTIPSRAEAARLLLSLEPPEWHVRHSRAVADVAAWLALRISRAGADGSGPRVLGGPARGRVNRGLVEAAALLHDLDKVLPRAIRGDDAHGEAGGRWLRNRGHGELAEAVALHPVTLLVDAAGAGRVLGASLEARIVAYADKRAGQRLEPMPARFDDWRRRHPHSTGGHGWMPAAVEAARRHATELEAEICALAGCRPQDVRRLRWTEAALDSARGARPTASVGGRQ